MIYHQLRIDVGETLRTLCRYKGVEMIEEHLMSNHVHMLVMIPPKLSVSSVISLNDRNYVYFLDKVVVLKNSIEVLNNIYRLIF